MALPPGVARWTMQGTSSAEEVWAFDWWTSPGTGVADAAAWQTTVDNMWAVVVANGLHTNLASVLPVGGSVTGLVGLYYRNAQTAEFSAQHLASPVVAGTSNTHAVLSQSFVITTLTARPGQSYRGRAYLPANGMPLDVNARFTAGSMTALATAFRNVLAAGNTVGAYGPPVVVSRTLTVATTINAVRYDLKPDIQRRRANRQSIGTRTVVAV